MTVGRERVNLGDGIWIEVLRRTKDFMAVRLADDSRIPKVLDFCQLIHDAGFNLVTVSWAPGNFTTQEIILKSANSLDSNR